MNRFTRLAACLAAAGSAAALLAGTAGAALTATAPATDLVVEPLGGGANTIFFVKGTKDAGDTSLQVRLRWVSSTTSPLPTDQPAYLVRSAAPVTGGETTYAIPIDGYTLRHLVECTNVTCTTTGDPYPIPSGTFFVEVAKTDGSSPVRAPGRIAIPVFYDDAREVGQTYADVNLPLGGAILDAAFRPAFAYGDFTARFPGAVWGPFDYANGPSSYSEPFHRALHLSSILDGDGAVLAQPSGSGSGFESDHRWNADGSVTVTYAYRLHRADAGNTTAVDAGVRLQRTFRISPTGTTVQVVDVWSNAADAERRLSATYEAWGDPTSVAWLFPWQSATYGLSANRTSVDGAPSNGYLAVQDNANPGPTGDHGWLSWERRPDALAFESATPENQLTRATYALTIPARGSVTLRFGVGATTTGAAAEATGAASAASYPPPAVSIAAPVNGATVTSASVPVSGTATDNRGVASLTVNGAAVTPGAGGAWSTTTTLTPGTNAITAIATDADGNETRATVTVTYAPPGTPLCTVPALAGLKLADATAAAQAAGCALGKVTKRVAPRKKRGAVLSQGVPAGWQRAAGATIDVVVGKAPKPKKKPAARGR